MGIIGRIVQALGFRVGNLYLGFKGLGHDRSSCGVSKSFTRFHTRLGGTKTVGFKLSLQEKLLGFEDRLRHGSAATRAPTEAQ